MNNSIEKIEHVKASIDIFKSTVPLYISSKDKITTIKLVIPEHVRSAIIKHLEQRLEELESKLAEDQYTEELNRQQERFLKEVEPYLFEE